jgi:Ni/Co efflux regulator RcnB
MANIKKTRFRTFVLGAALAVFSAGAYAQNPNGDDRRSRDNDRRSRDNDRRGNEERSDYRFRSEDRNHFSDHYKKQIRQYQQHPDRRRHVRAGEQLPNDYRSRLKPVPQAYYRSVPPPPRGYQFGYYDGYVVAYNPTTRIVADVLDLVDAAVRH